MNGYSPLIKDKKRLQYQLFLFIIWPFGAFLSSLRNIKSRNFLVMYVLFCILLCWNMDVNKTAGYDDLSGMASIFMYVDHSTSAFIARLKAYITFADNAPREIYTYFMMWLTHLISDNPHTFFAISAVPYLFFQIKCFRIIMEDNRFVSGFTGVLLIFLFMFPRDIITVQNPRFNIALWVCIYVVLKTFLDSTYSSKHMLWLLVTPLIHSSYWLLAPVIFLGILIGKFGKGEAILITLVYLTIPFSYMSIDLGAGINLSNLLPLPDALVSWMQGYAEGEKEIQSSGNSGFYWVPIFFDILRTTVYLMIPIVLLRNRQLFSHDKKCKQLFLLYLYLYVFVNVAQIFPVICDRSKWFIQILSIYMLFRVFGLDTKMYVIILIGSAWAIFSRYYGGVFERSVPYIIFYTPLPYILYEYWGVTKMDVQVLDGVDIERYL